MDQKGLFSLAFHILLLTSYFIRSSASRERLRTV